MEGVLQKHIAQIETTTTELLTDQNARLDPLIRRSPKVRRQVRSQNSKSRQGKNINPKTEGVAINGQSICFGMSNDLRLLLPYAGQSTCTSTSFCQSRARTAFRRNSGSSISERWGLRLDNPSKRRYQVRLARV